ncbi:HAD family hydrolase [Reyranella sp. CPCC 100927]|uniref:HAD family hydrolase n=1 Tax=Reyranella sp. CPCC 100927 TaxID=2599616 RepID=UPI0011B37BB8|nr:HAD family hydrolase [Reyranella sp. CPCC 100927]TWT08827.1 HAD family hydrolase [Reyranella sp. CPCC 100927]
MPITTLLFDVGGPLDTEEAFERAVDRLLPQAVRRQGIDVTSADYDEACARAVESFAPNLYQAVIWRLCNGDVFAAHRAWTLFSAEMARNDLAEARPGMIELLAALRASGFSLGIVANQPLTLAAKLERLGMAGLFDSADGSAQLGFHKPDPRLFLTVCARLGAVPADCLMVGDRIDNDIVPARLLGMRTVRFRAGRHAAQAPRSWTELPDADVATVDELAAAIDRLAL